jgi:uncharacterized protein (TIRG00374 family)
VPSPSRRQIIFGLVSVAAAAGFLYYVVPRLAGLDSTLDRLRDGSPWWFGAGVVFEVLSIVAYIALFRAVFSSDGGRIGWRSSTQIILSGAAATKLFAAAGAGGIALEVWALRASGLSSEEVGQRMVAYQIISYAVFVAMLVVGGLGLWLGLFAGPSPTGLTLVPALLGLAVILIAVSMLFVAAPAEKWLLKHANAAGERAARWWRRAAAVPSALKGGLETALRLVRRRDPWLLSAIPAWGFDIAVLWAAFNAFGDAPPVAVLVMGYLVGTTANVIPLPGGVGGVESGMIAAFLAFGVDGSLAVLAVLGYRTISYWLPFVPGMIAYVGLRRRVSDWQDDTANVSRTASG